MKSQQTPSLSEKARVLLSQLIDANWDIKQHQDNHMGNDNFFSELLNLKKKYVEIEQALIEEMGQEHYDNFINMGRRMFASAN